MPTFRCGSTADSLGANPNTSIALKSLFISGGVRETDEVRRGYRNPPLKPIFV